jgi:TrmH family RNA methyltransferase
MGAHFHLSCIEMDWDQIGLLLHENELVHYSVFTAIANGELNFWDCNFTQPTVLIIGSESEGVSEQALGITSHTVSIPMPGNFESLNAAVAAGIIIFEIVKQRTKKK